MLRSARLLVLSLIASLSLAPPALSDPTACPQALTARIPARPSGAMGGAELMEHLDALPPDAREAAIIAEVLAGNIPDLLRHLVPVVLTGAAGHGRAGSLDAIVCVMPDFVAIGSHDDFVRVPMSFPAARTIARELGFILPTPKIVTAIDEQAAFHFEPVPMTPGPLMSSPGYYRTHNRAIEAQWVRAGMPRGALVEGHKKTVVLTNRLNEHPGRVAIFGWFRLDGTAIQPLSTVHGAGYADYSHGIRLLSESVMVGGKRRSIYDLLQDPEAAFVLSEEGAIRGLEAMMGSRAASASLIAVSRPARPAARVSPPF
jgi:hypothetical protein